LNRSSSSLCGTIMLNTMSGCNASKKMHLVDDAKRGEEEANYYGHEAVNLGR
jgi:hypothetical protein